VETATPVVSEPELAATGLDASRVAWQTAVAGALLVGGVGLLLISRHRPAQAVAARHRPAGGRRH
jgi:hypothetical protein